MINSNINLITSVWFFFVSLIGITHARKNLTYKGVQLLLIMVNGLLLAYSTYYWDDYVVKHVTEFLAIKINVNVWNNLPYEIKFKINTLTYSFLFLVNIIGFATNVYILNYFKYEERGEEFILLINWFIFSMIFLVISNNFFTLIIGWELIGLTSFLLINFWKFKTSTLACSFKAYAFNKVSDLFLMLGCAMLWNTYKISDIDTLLMYISLNNSNKSVIYWSSICFLISACIKSAQIIGHLWLPDSMEAPVPASSLIHSATLVSAGIYLILKFHTLFINCELLGTIFFIGSLTACYGGIVAAAQTDMKKLLAYSTISHCGFIMASISLNNFVVTIVYLYLHGLFKALTFFCAGSIIRANGTQDTRFMGMNTSQAFDTTILIISSINLGGLPFTFGYLYKQLFITHLTINTYSYFSFGFCLMGLLTSSVYVYKLIYYSCFDFRKGYLPIIQLLIQNNQKMLNNFFFGFTLGKFFSSTIVYIYAILFYIVIKFFFLKNYTFFYYIPEVTSNEHKYLFNYFLLKKSIASLYYILFLVVNLILILNSSRDNYFYHNKSELLLNIWGLLNFMLLITGLIRLLNKYAFIHLFL